MRELDIEEKDKLVNRNFIIAWIGAIAILVLIDIIGIAQWGIVLAMIVGMYGFIYLMNKQKKDKEKANLRAGKIKSQKPASDYKGKDYQATMSELQGAGFFNIKVIAMGDLTAGILKKPGKIESISINGNDSFDSGEWFQSDESVIISYHSFALNKWK